MSTSPRKAPHTSKLEQLESNMSLGPSFDGMLSLDGLDEDLSATLPSLADAAASSDNHHRGRSRSDVRIMSEYAPEQFVLALEQAGVGDAARALRLGAPLFQVDLSGNYVHRVSVSTDILSKTPNGTRPPTPDPETPVPEKGPWTIIVLDRKGHGGFHVGDSNFLLDLFVRRRYMAFKDLKCYQEIMRTLPEHESNLLIAMTRSITRGLRMLPPFASSTTSSHTDEATAVTNTAPTDTLRISNPDEPVRASSFEDEPPATLPEGITRMQHLASDAATRFQHEFKIEGDGATAKTLHTFLTAHLPSRLSVTVVEWLAMQNPTRAFTPARPQLPGQHHPGLGLGRTVTKMLVAISREKGRDCLLSIPEYFHNAVAYKAAGWFFVNPAFEGYMRALLIDLGADLETKGLSAVSWAFQNCHVVDANGVVEVWQAQEQILSVSNRMKSYLASSEYVRLVTKFTKRYAGKLHIDWSSAKELDKYLLPGAAPAYQAEE